MIHQTRTPPQFSLGFTEQGDLLSIPASVWTTHAVVLGATGSGKTGLSIVIAEEALRVNVPVLLVDIKGDLANILLTFPNFLPQEIAPWIDQPAYVPQEQTLTQAQQWVSQTIDGLAQAGISQENVRQFTASRHVRLITPGAVAGEGVDLLAALEQSTSQWTEDEGIAREQLSSAISLLLRWSGRNDDPVKSREHVLLSILAERRITSQQPCGIVQLITDLQSPPVASIGALSLDDYVSPKERAQLAQSLNTLLSSPTLSRWRTGSPLDLHQWLVPGDDGKVPLTVFSVAHLESTERELVLALLFERILSWVQKLKGTQHLRALVVIDEAYGLLPPAPAQPPTKRALLGLFKQARAFGVGVAIATQNPMDLDYKSLSNAGLWFIGKLATDADRARVVDALSTSLNNHTQLDQEIKSLGHRRFLVHNTQLFPAPISLRPRWAMSFLRGPMTKQDLRDRYQQLELSSHPPVPHTSTVLSTNTSESLPRLPTGWMHWFLPRQSDNTVACTWTPYSAVIVIAHFADAQWNLRRKQQHAWIATFDPGSVIVIDSIRSLDERSWSSQNQFRKEDNIQALPDVLSAPKRASMVERVWKDYVCRSVSLRVRVHKKLHVIQSENESEEAFILRCNQAAASALAQQTEQIHTKYRVKITHTQEQVAIAKSEVEKAKANTGGTAATISTAIVGLLGPRKIASHVKKAHQHVTKAAEKAERNLLRHEQALTTLKLAESQDIELAKKQFSQVDTQIEWLTLLPKLSDVQIVQCGVLWIPS